MPCISAVVALLVFTELLVVVFIFFLFLSPLDQAPLIMMWVGSPLNYFCACPRYGGSSDVSWSCGHHLLWSCFQYWSSVCCVVFLSIWVICMINIFLRYLIWNPLILLWTSHHTWCWIPEQQIQSGLYVDLWLQWRIQYLPWCWTYHTIGRWWGSVDQKCKMPLLVYSR